MTNEERNRIMDKYFEQFDFRGIVAQDAIRACDKKARAWDALEEWAKILSWERERISIRTLRFKMAEFLEPPKPKSKLERLKEKILDGGVRLTLACLCGEIDQLIKEDKT
jgi:hypothetical protein